MVHSEQKVRDGDSNILFVCVESDRGGKSTVPSFRRSNFNRDSMMTCVLSARAVVCPSFAPQGIARPSARRLMRSLALISIQTHSALGTPHSAFELSVVDR